MVPDIFLIPALSVKCKRTFSQAKLAYGIHRRKLGNNTVEKLRMLQQRQESYVPCTRLVGVRASDDGGGGLGHNDKP